MVKNIFAWHGSGFHVFISNFLWLNFVCENKGGTNSISFLFFVQEWMGKMYIFQKVTKTRPAWGMVCPGMVIKFKCLAYYNRFSNYALKCLSLLMLCLQPVKIKMSAVRIKLSDLWVTPLDFLKQRRQKLI